MPIALRAACSIRATAASLWVWAKTPRGRLGVAVSDFRGVCVAPQREGPLAGLRSDFWRRGEAQSHRRRRGCRPRQVSQIGPVGSLDVRAVGRHAEWVEFTPAQVGTATSNAGGRDRGGHPPGPPLLSPSLDAAPQLAVEVEVEAHVKLSAIVDCCSCDTARPTTFSKQL